MSDADRIALDNLSIIINREFYALYAELAEEEAGEVPEKIKSLLKRLNLSIVWAMHGLANCDALAKHAYFLMQKPEYSDFKYMELGDPPLA